MDDKAATIKQGLLVELFRDADNLIERLECAKEGLSEKLTDAPRIVGELAHSAAAALASSAGSERDKWSREARAVTVELQRVANGVTSHGRGLLPLLAVVGLGSGAVGGLVVAIVLKVL